MTHVTPYVGQVCMLLGHPEVVMAIAQLGTSPADHPGEAGWAWCCYFSCIGPIYGWERVADLQPGYWPEPGDIL